MPASFPPPVIRSSIRWMTPERGRPARNRRVEMVVVFAQSILDEVLETLLNHSQKRM